MLYGDFVFGISLLQTILFALFAILTLFQGRLGSRPLSFPSDHRSETLKLFVFAPIPLEFFKLRCCSL
ncbi:hypothetical protein [Leptospira noguchii]|uniref:hypothetical protein n=1 Tax=Leptospira noguchii TaxID=28182 RepID=UPI002FC3CF42